MDSKPSGTIADNVSDQSDTVSTIVIENEPKQNADNIQKLQVNSNCKKKYFFIFINYQIIEWAYDKNADDDNYMCDSNSNGILCFFLWGIEDGKE